MNINNQINYWLKSAEHDLDAAEGLFSIGKNDWCLFLGHLVIEKTLRAFYLKSTNNQPPKTHNLLYFSEKSNLKLSSKQKLFLEKTNDFNLEARYPDEKLSFYKICTKEFTNINFTQIKDFYQWLLTRL